MSAIHHPEAATEAPPLPRRWLMLALLCTAQAMLIIDITVVNIALPTIGAELRLDREALTWIVTGYTLVFGGLMLFGGRLADLFGRRRMLLIGLSLFTAASLAAGLAQTGPVLLGGRLAQGLGAALMAPAILSTVTTAFHGTERHRALGLLSAIAGGGAALGVLVGGVLTAGPGWQWIFYINVPIGAVILALLPGVLPADARPSQRERVDVPGALLVTAATAALIFGLVRAGDDGWTSPTTLGALTAAVILYAVFALVERRTAAPLMRVALLARRTVVTGAFLMLMATALLISFFFLGSLYLQDFAEYSALRTGLLFLPVAVATTIGAQLAAHLIGKTGPRPIAVAGMVLAAAASGWLAMLKEDSGAAAVVAGLALGAFALGTLFITANATALSRVDPHEAGVASGMVTTFHELGGSVGVAVMSTVAVASIGASVPTLSGFTDAFLVCAIASGVAALIALILVPGGKVEMSGGPHGH
ncbi:MFS transporter [Glycomyces algeriensis]|uniref:MFS transporter n=1 Tax=Glycomyces algeriensis TaxID=256037 RepID=A0A9W6LJK8_9ACTN|nr:MFS transporter [Glycomyces algeriensis]MDA1368613.1 MFS transporter [Glycomyces algeriensis]MDR7352412.1 EmrB/QacA subfamily drug resistance transporter [Glycomyces algeriensis]GLI45149.1 MFS transporter [Glycomyces algeriensis]